MMKIVTMILLEGISRRAAPSMETSVPRRRIFQSDIRLRIANRKTSARPGISRKNSSEPRCWLVMSCISERKLFMVAAKQPVPMPQTRMLRKNDIAVLLSLKTFVNFIVGGK